jgi:hypothetical protein
VEVLGGIASVCAIVACCMKCRKSSD